MAENVKCYVCLSDSYVTVYKSPLKKRRTTSTYTISESSLMPPERIVKCAECGFIYANPRIDARRVLEAYKKMKDESYVLEEKGRRSSSRKILKILEKFKIKGNKLLDVGCSTGFLLDEARKMRWDVTGVELSTWAAGYAREKFGLKVYNTSLKKIKMADNSFDVVILKDTIEHVLDPRALLLEIRRILKPGGILYVNTPDIESNSSRLLRAKWWGINQFHLCYFSKRTLIDLLAFTGFATCKCIAHTRTFSFGYWVKRFESYNKIIHKILVVISKNLGLSDRLFTVNLWDQIGIFARRDY